MKRASAVVLIGASCFSRSAPAPRLLGRACLRRRALEHQDLEGSAAAAAGSSDHRRQLRASGARPTFRRGQLFAERRIYSMIAAVTLDRTEADLDHHLVLRSGSRTMIAETPSALCTAGATAIRRKQMVAARRAGRVCARPRVVGVAFFEYKHGQTGVAPNGIELHPILGFACLSKVGPPPPPPPPLGGKTCAPSYPGVCIPPPPPDLNCPDIPYRNFRVRWDVAIPDPHGFDGNRTGVGCET